ncbi:MAG: OmpA family protein [Reyranellales bacterium]
MAVASLLGACAQPPAPPPPPVTVPPPVSFMTFFDWGSVKLSPQANATIAEAAQSYKSRGNGHVAVTGYADTTGGDAFNMQLSQRRADAVKGGLVGAGVPATAITTAARGESGLLVDTGPQSKEPRNRRVEIVVGQ